MVLVLRVGAGCPVCLCDADDMSAAIFLFLCGRGLGLGRENEEGRIYRGFVNPPTDSHLIFIPSHPIQFYSEPAIHSILLNLTSLSSFALSFELRYILFQRRSLTTTIFIMSSFTSQSQSMAVFGRGGYNAPVDAGRGGYNAPVDAGRGGYNGPVNGGGDDDDEAEDGRGGYN